MDFELTFDLLPAFGVLLVFLNQYVPKFKDWYAGLSPDVKQSVNGAVLLAVTVGVVVLSQVGVLDVYVGDTWTEWAYPAVVDFFIALMANAGTYKAVNYIIEK